MATPMFKTTDVSHTTLAEFCPIPIDKISSKVLISTDSLQQIVFCLGAGQELADHHTPNLATILLLEGAAEIRVKRESHALENDSFVVIPPRVTHSVHASEPTRFLLTLCKELN